MGSGSLGAAAEGTPPDCSPAKVATPCPPAALSHGGAGDEGDDDCGGSCGTEEDIEEDPDCATTLSSTTATDATSADGSPSESEPLTPSTPQRLPLSVPLLPPAEDPNRMTLVLDLDGTLIASEDEPHAPVPFDYCVDEERFVWLRPGLRRFLESVRPMFEVVLFTAAGESWATCAMQRIDPDGRIFDTRLYRDHTVSHDDWPWVKDLSRLGRDLARVVIVDDNPLMFMYQPDNALHVAPYDPQVTGHRDDVLEQVLDVLMHKVLPAEDVREVLKHMKDPISPSCVASRRHVAAKAPAGAAPMSAVKSFLRMNQTIGGSSSGCSASQQQHGSRRRGGNQGDVTASRGAAGHQGGGVGGAPGSSSGRSGRRSRRGGKDGLVHGQQQAQPHSLQVGAHARDQGQHGASGGGGNRSKRRSRSQRLAAKSNDATAAAQPQAQTEKQAINAGRRAAVVAQQSASTALQQPDKQLHLKLRLLQLQREQEAEEATGELDREAATSSASGAGAASLYAALAAIAKDEDGDDVLEGTIRGGRTVVGRVPALQAAKPGAMAATVEQEVAARAPQTLQAPKATPMPMLSAWGRPPHKPWGVAPSAAPSAAGSPERSALASSSGAGASPDSSAGGNTATAGGVALGSARPLNYAAVVAGLSTCQGVQSSPAAVPNTASACVAATMESLEHSIDERDSPRRRSRGRRGRRGRKTSDGPVAEEVQP
ncbi:hypothetical protein HYH02_005005 [Chlamydomonas schloesseri]|uniref:FCP1 homology domain-containing protein n=1 Tax=Chlamydomonas schloesseri TaxID=2026947 RepID=A0A836B8N1_9CHLO|nr:hypothetical protein HYH02_005005 [Chlamydomonas schloesseri]|eukprot:KAG2450504.1 hypothetical protein HYH02_005005 [Chlamydomonas schloesseri]